MSIRKLSFFAGVAVVFAVLAQSSDAQSFRQLTTRRGAIAGAIIGGIAGNQNNETLAGVAIGGLVGGVAGRIIGNQAENYYRGPQGYYAPRYVGPQYASPRYVQPQFVQPRYVPAYPPARYYSAPAYVPRRSCGGFGY